jgi:D-alanine-D-alanine ligase
MDNKPKILILAGGDSEERAVSLASAKAITESLIRLGYMVKAIDSASGQSLLGEDGRYLYDKDTASISTIALKEKGSMALTRSINSEEYGDVDVVFLALHGGMGEDGTIQALLDLAGKKYTGSGILASAIAMNKAFAKSLVKKENIPTPDWILLKSRNLPMSPADLIEIKGRFSFPVIVKPNDSGSTVGLTLVKRESDLEAALKEAAEVSKEILVEKYIKGREITSAILCGRSLPLVEIIPTNELYDYQCKYTKGKSQYICPAQIPSDVADKIRDMAARAYQVMGCEGLCRADFILEEPDSPFFLEVNTLPGMTELSLAPMAAREAGIDFDHLIEKIIYSAMEK